MSRGVKRHQHFDERFEELVPDPRTRDAILVGIEVTIAEEPRVGEPLDDMADSCWLVEIPEAAGWGTRRMVLIYTFDDDDVWLTWID
jgi:hypothetical protein